MSADLIQPHSQIEASLSVGENEGGASATPSAPARATQLEAFQLMNTELKQLHIRMIAAKKLLIALLAQDPDLPGRLARAMVTCIYPRPVFTRHTRMLGATPQLVDIVTRSWHLPGWVKGGVLS